MYDDISPATQKIGRYMAEHCEKGLPEHFGDELIDAFPNLDAKSIKLALAELEAEGMVDLSPVIGPKLPRVRTTYELFIACDPAITGHDPVADSVVLARLLLEDPKLGGTASKLEAAAGWDRRRFNPALALIKPCVAEGRTRKPLQNEYAVMGFVLDEEDLVQLQRYVRGHAS